MNILKSPTPRTPVDDEEAIFTPNTPVRLLYVSGQFAERDVSPIFDPIATPRVPRFPERVRKSDESKEKLAFVAAREPEIVERFVVRVEIFVVFVAIFPVAVAILEYILLNPEFTVAILPESEPTVLERAS